jgi:hypothetical protein
LKNKAIRLIKWPKARLENLLISPGHNGRIREEAIRNYLRGDRQKPPCTLNIAPTSQQSEMTLAVDDYWWKCA